MCARTQQLEACFDHCIATGMSLAACAAYINNQGLTTATDGAFTPTSLPDALIECGFLPSPDKELNNAPNND